MKKSLLVISVVLLIAGLFISCNSEAAVTNSEVGYVKFGGTADSKALGSSITPEPQEPVANLYWYYKATPVNPGLFIQGTKDSWTAVSSDKGLSGTIGPFSKGTWSFEIVGSSSDTAPSADTSFNGPTWTIASGDDSYIKYYGVSGSTYDVKTPVYIQGSATAPTLIPVGLKYNSHATADTFTLTLSNVILLKSTTDITVNNGYTVYYDVKDSSDNVVMSGSVVTADGTATITSASETVTSTSDAAATFTVFVYTDSARTNKVNYDSVEFTPYTGSTVTVTGSLGHLSIETGYGKFADIDSTLYEAYVYDGETYTGKETLSAALEAATANQTVGLLRDITTNGYYTISENITLDGNSHTINTNTTPATSAAPSSVATYDCVIYIENTSATINNLTVSNNRTSGASDKHRVGIFIDNINDKTISLSRCNISSTEYPIAISNVNSSNTNVVNGLNLNISDSRIEGYGAINHHGSSSNIVIDNSTLIGNGIGGPTNAFSTITIDGTAYFNPGQSRSNNTVTIQNHSKIVANDGTGHMNWLSFQYGADDNNAIVSVDNTCLILSAETGGSNKYDKFGLAGSGNSISLYLTEEQAETLHMVYNIDGTNAPIYVVTMDESTVVNYCNDNVVFYMVFDGCWLENDEEIALTCDFNLVRNVQWTRTDNACAKITCGEHNFASSNGAKIVCSSENLSFKSDKNISSCIQFNGTTKIYYSSSDNLYLFRSSNNTSAVPSGYVEQN